MICAIDKKSIDRSLVVTLFFNSSSLRTCHSQLRFNRLGNIVRIFEAIVAKETPEDRISDR